MIEKLRTFIATLKDNPLFMREWRRVLGRWPVFLFRAATVGLLIFAAGEILFWFRWDTASIQGSKFIHKLAYIATDMLFWSILDPANLFAVAIAWWSIEFEHRRGMGGPIALTRLKSRDLFWAKAVPIFCFAAAAIYFCFCISQVYVVVRYNDAITLIEALWFIVSRTGNAAGYLVNILICYFFMMKWPSLRRGGVVVIPALIVSGLINAAVFYFPYYVLHPLFHYPLATEWKSWWKYFLDPAFRSAVTFGLIFLLIKIVAPQFRCLFVGEAPRFPFIRFMRVWARVRRAWVGARRWG